MLVVRRKLPSFTIHNQNARLSCLHLEKQSSNSCGMLINQWTLIIAYNKQINIVRFCPETKQILEARPTGLIQISISEINITTTQMVSSISELCVKKKKVTLPVQYFVSTLKCTSSPYLSLISHSSIEMTDVDFSFQKFHRLFETKVIV